MARVPRIQSPGAQVLGIASRSLHRLSDVLRQQEAEEQRIRMREIDTEYGLALQTLYYGEDGQGGFASLQGKAAVDALPGFMSQLSELRKETLATAEGVDPRILEAAFNRKDEILKGRALEKTAIARQEYDQQLSQSRIQLAVNNAGVDPRSLQEANETIEAEVLYQEGKRGHGVDSPLVQLKIMQARGELVTNAVAQAMSTGNYQRAATILKRAGPTGDLAIEADVRAKLVAKFQNQMIDVEASSKVDQAIALHGDDKKAAYKWLEENTKGALQDAAIAEFMKGEKNEGYLINRKRSDYDHRVKLLKHAEEQVRKETVLTLQQQFLAGEYSNWKDLMAKHQEAVLSLSPSDQNALIKFMDNMNGGLKEPTAFGQRVYNNLMTSFEDRQDLDYKDLLRLGEHMPRDMIQSLIRTVQEDREDNRRLTRRSVDKRFKNTIDAFGLGGENWREVRGILTADFYQQLETKEVDLSDRAAVDKIMQDVFDPKRVQALVSQNRTSEKASTTTTQKLNAMYRVHEIEDDRTRGVLDTMFREVVDKSYGGQPSATQMDEAERMLLTNEISVAGWFFGLKSKKNLVEIFESMSQDDINKVRSELVSRGNADPTRAQIAFYYGSQQ